MSLAGLQTSTRAIVYSAGLEPLDSNGVTALPANDASNMFRWAPDIRALLLESVFTSKLQVTIADAGKQVSLGWAGTPIWQVLRPTDKTVASQVGLVRIYIDQRPDRAAEIISQLAPFGPFFGIILGLREARNRITLELLRDVQNLAGLATMLPKHVLACRRPDEIDTRILPFVPTPGHGSYPSAHATQAFAMATVLAALVRSMPAHFADTEKRIDLLFRQAHRIAVNRTVAGVHFPMDSQAGAILGVQIGRVLVGLMTGKTTLRAVQIHDPNAKPSADFLFNADVIPMLDPADAPTIATPADPLFGWFWAQAQAEFAGPVQPGV